jgi:hypothetical protein
MNESLPWSRPSTRARSPPPADAHPEGTVPRGGCVKRLVLGAATVFWNRGPDRLIDQPDDNRSEYDNIRRLHNE